MLSFYAFRTLDRVEERKKRKLDPMVEVEKYLKAKSKKKTEDKHNKHKRKYKEVNDKDSARFRLEVTLYF